MSRQFKKIPEHIAFIMDGNGRWATQRALPRLAGHAAGVMALKKTILACKKFNIKYATFYAFSTENWKRDKNEVDGIFNLLKKYIGKENNFFVKNKIKFNVLGVLDRFSDDLQQVILKTIENTKDFGDNMIVSIALNYGGRDEIIRAVNKILKSGKNEITEKEFSNYLDTNLLPDPDLIVRTSGEERLSNFLLYQLAYSELYFPTTYWPDFNEKEVLKCLEEYEKRERKYGGVKWEQDCWHHLA